MNASRTVRGRRVPCVAVCVVVVIVIILYGALLRRCGARDPLARPIFSHPICQDIDGWSVSHVLFFALLGWLYPGRPLQFLLLGAGWEVVETALGQNRLEVSGRRVQLIGDQDASGRPTGEADAYWYGKESDIIMDMLGYCLGSAAAQRYWPEPCGGAPGPAAT